MAKYFVFVVLSLSVSTAWGADCLSSYGQLCLRKSQVGGFSVYMSDGDPCFTYSSKRWCFVQMGRLSPCQCTPECGCKGAEEVEPPPKCDNSNVPTEFEVSCARGESNTMCQYTGIGEECQGKVCVHGLSDEQKEEVVKKHNDLRRQVAKGQETKGVGEVGQPEAANMEELVWDDDLAVVAQRWTDQCQGGHDEDPTTPTMSPVGQNFAMKGSTVNSGEVSLGDFVQMWYDEVKDFKSSTVGAFTNYKKNQPSQPHTGVVGHYTQAVWATTKKVGCGYIQFEKQYTNGKTWYNRHLVCNYYPAGNWIGQAVYSVGEAGSQCPSGQSNDGLCV